jgi:hypothetical protein
MDCCIASGKCKPAALVCIGALVPKNLFKLFSACKFFLMIRLIFCLPNISDFYIARCVRKKVILVCFLFAHNYRNTQQAICSRHKKRICILERRSTLARFFWSAIKKWVKKVDSWIAETKNRTQVLVIETFCIRRQCDRNSAVPTYLDTLLPRLFI